MLTRIQHAAIVSENFVREAKFYEVGVRDETIQAGLRRRRKSDQDELRNEYQRRLCRRDGDR